MYTIIETPAFQEDARRIWSEQERGAFCAWLAANPEVGDIIPGRWLKSIREVIEHE